MEIANASRLLAGAFALLYGLFMTFYLFVVWARYPNAIDISPIGLEVVDAVAYLIFGVNMLRNRTEFFVFTIYWTVFSVVSASFAVTYRTPFLNFWSFVIIFLSTLHYVSVTNPTVTYVKRSAWWTAILALMQGILVTVATVSNNFLNQNKWIIVVPLHVGINAIAPPLSIGALTAIIYLAIGVGILRTMRREFFLLAIIWTLSESGLAALYSAFIRSHFYVFSILNLVLATYFYLARTRT